MRGRRREKRLPISKVRALNPKPDPDWALKMSSGDVDEILRLWGEGIEIPNIATRMDLDPAAVAGAIDAATKEDSS